jgi:hypothetical protein
LLPILTPEPGFFKPKPPTKRPKLELQKFPNNEGGEQLLPPAYVPRLIRNIQEIYIKINDVITRKNKEPLITTFFPLKKQYRIPDEHLIFLKNNHHLLDVNI